MPSKVLGGGGGGGHVFQVRYWGEGGGMYAK